MITVQQRYDNMLHCCDITMTTFFNEHNSPQISEAHLFTTTCYVLLRRT